MYNKQVKKFNYLEPYFPEKAYLLILFVFENGLATNIIPLSGVYEDYKTATKAVEPIYEECKNYNQNLPDHALLLPLTFSSSVPLKKQYWDKPTLKYNSWDRIHHFLKVLKNPKMYHILIVPRFINSKGVQFLEATIPVMPEDTKTIERFMLSSDQIVDIKAKHAALYQVDKLLRINWRTNKVEPLLEEKKELN